MANKRQYTIGWVCALHTELAAARAFLTEEYVETIKRKRKDANTYMFGSMGEHNVVIACLPNGQYGTNSAATVVTNLIRSFPEVRFVLMVGIAGGAPSATNDVRLGDVVVATPGPGHGGVLQYDFGKYIQGPNFVVTGHLSPPPSILGTAIQQLRVSHDFDPNNLDALVKEALARYPRLKSTYSQPELSEDVLYESDCIHQLPTERCDQACTRQVPREPRGEDEDPFAVHYGLIASGNSLMKDAMLRDKYSAEKGVLCFEMEAAGMMNVTGCAVIRGICDYSDTHKNKKWQGFAAMTAAAYASSLLKKMQPEEVQGEEKLGEVIEHIRQGLDSIGQETNAIGKAVGDLQSKQLDGSIKSWLAAPGPSVNATSARDRRHPGTGQWFLASKQFLQWKQGDRRHMWLHGMPGCGKTVLATTILDHVAALKDSITTWFFFDFSDRSLQTVDGMLRSLLSQLHEALSGLHDPNQDLAKLFKKQTTTPVSAATFTTCLKAMTNGPRKVYIILDALDECSQRPLLLSWMENLLSDKKLGQCQLIATGRPEHEFRSRLQPLIGEDNCIELDKEAVDADIRAYVDFQIDNSSELSRWSGNHTVRQLIREEIGNKAGGMFRWVACQLESLYPCIDRKQVEEVLRTLPKTLDETYSRILSQIPQASKSSTIRLLQFLICSDGPLVLSEAVDIVAMRPENSKTPFDADDRPPRPSEVVGYCPYFITLTRFEKAVEHSAQKIKVEAIHLAHFSIKEYLLRTGGSFARVQAKTSIKGCCKAYLECLRSTLVSSPTTARPGDFPLGPYAARNWLKGLPLLERQVYDPDGDGFQYPIHDYYRFFKVLDRIVHTEPTARRWRFFLLEQQAAGLVDEKTSLVSFLCREGLSEIAVLVLFTADPSLEVGRGMTMEGRLYLATQRNSTASVRILLHNAPGLLCSLKQGRMKAKYNIAQLVQSGCSVDMIKVHIQEGVMLEEEHNSALFQAARQEHWDMAEFLLANVPDANAARVDHSGPLGLAVKSGHSRMVESLLKHGANANAVCVDDFTPLGLAAKFGHYDIIELLIGYGADANAVCVDEFTPLELAAKLGHYDIMGPLIGWGADVNAVSCDGFVPLAMAVAKSSKKMAEPLISAGAQVNAPSANGFTPLGIAVDNANLEMIRMLVDNGADLDAQHQPGRQQPFKDKLLGLIISAAEREMSKNPAQFLEDIWRPWRILSNENTVSSDHFLACQLVDRGARVEKGCEAMLGSVLLYASSQYSMTSTIKLLLDQGANPNSSINGETPLTWAARCGNEQTVRLLLKHGAMTDQEYPSHGSALYFAILQIGFTRNKSPAQVEIVELLIAAGAKVDESAFPGHNSDMWSAKSYRLVMAGLKNLRGSFDGGSFVSRQLVTFGNTFSQLYLKYGPPNP
ncbi:hypothetical protein MCOR01_001986 [Pyricularia oryzae]|nr:hypothetical protein MCOR01_001986 [Pyricularia oryzae]